MLGPILASETKNKNDETFNNKGYDNLSRLITNNK